MSRDPDLDRALDQSDLLVMLDVRHPLAFLALGPAIVFGRELALSMDWLPLRVPALKPPSTPGPADDRGIRHRRYRAQALAREIETYAAVQGLDLREPYRAAEAPAVDRAWLYVRAHARPALESFLEVVFAAYWRCALDPADPQALAPLVSAAGLDAAGFLDWSAATGARACEATAAALAARGFGGVPGYLVRGEYFLGRQHLPMIRWLLADRQGPVPI